MESLLLESYTDEEVKKMSKELVKNKLIYGLVIKKVAKEIMKGSKEPEKGSLSLSEE